MTKTCMFGNGESRAKCNTFLRLFFTYKFIGATLPGLMSSNLTLSVFGTANDTSALFVMVFISFDWNFVGVVLVVLFFWKIVLIG